MNKIIKLSFTLGAFLPLIVNAADSKDIVDLQSIEVKGQSGIKQDYKIDSFYKSYSSELFIKDDLSEKSAINLKDVLKDVSNIKVKDMGSFSRSLSIRGFSGERVSSIVDGAKMSNHGMTMGGGGELSLVESSSVEKMELIKGSPSVVYDPGAVGGVIKVKTIKDTKKLKDKISLRHTYLYDQGYKLNKNITSLEAKYDNYYIQYSNSSEESDGRSVKDIEKVTNVLNSINEEREGENHVRDLSYNSSSSNLTFGYDLNDNINFFYKNFEKESEDITQAYGSLTPMAFHYDEYDRDGYVVGVDISDFYGFNHINIINNTQNLYKMSLGEANIKNEVELESDTKKIDVELPFFDFIILGGYEFTKDKARTYTYSRQEYHGFYLSTEYIYNDWTFIAGARNNYYKVEKDLKAGENPDVCADKVGISGCPPPKEDSKINHSLGLIYSINDFNNISVNYSRTYRYPSLYERFAYGGGFIGGDMDMKPEEADNYELSWKHLDDMNGLSIKAAIFRSDFDIYNSTILKVQQINDDQVDELVACREDPNCNPFDDILKSNLVYTSIPDVSSEGFEFGVEKQFKDANIITTFDIARTIIGDKVVNTEGTITKEESLQEPLEYSASIKKSFSNPYKPWAKLSLRHVTNNPQVNQTDGFDSFSVGHLYFGAKYKDYLSFNGGVKNITDRVYHEPYSPLDGVKRSFFFNVSLMYEYLL